MTGQYPSQKNMYSHITLNVRSVLVSWRVPASFFCRVRWQAFICYPIFIVKQNTHLGTSRSCVPLIGNRFRYPNSQVMRLISQYIKSKEMTLATNFFSWSLKHESIKFHLTQLHVIGLPLRLAVNFLIETRYSKTTKSIQTLSQLGTIRLNKYTLRQTISLSKI